MHRERLFVQESAAGSPALHKRRLFVQESAVGGPAVHKLRLFVQESAVGGSAVHKKELFVQESAVGAQPEQHIRFLWIQQRGGADFRRLDHLGGAVGDAGDLDQTPVERQPEAVGDGLAAGEEVFAALIAAGALGLRSG